MKGSTGLDHLDGTDEVAFEPSDTVRPQSTADIVTLLNAGVISLREARRYLGLGEELRRCA